MRILHVNKFLYRRGGTETYMLDLAAHQAAAGHTVGFFAMAHPQNPPDDHDHFFPPYLELDPPPDGLLAQGRTAARMLWSRRAEQGMEQTVDQFRPDVVHVNSVYFQLSPSVLRPLARRRIPTVMTLHDYKLACPTYHFLDHGKVCEACLGGHFSNAVRRRCNRGSLAASALVAIESAAHQRFGAYDPVGAFICPSQFMADKMRQAGVYPDRLHTLRHFADLDGIAPATEPGSGVIVASRLAPEKGIDVLVDAMGHLDPDVVLTIVGDGPDRATLEAQAARVAPGRITFTGWLGQAELHASIRRAAVLALPSRWYENQPMIVLEAFACATPVVGTDLGGIPELIRPGVDGEIVPSQDPRALAVAIAGLVADPRRARTMGGRGRAWVLESCSPGRHLAGLDEIYALAGAR